MTDVNSKKETSYLVGFFLSKSSISLKRLISISPHDSINVVVIPVRTQETLLLKKQPHFAIIGLKRHYYATIGGK